MEVERILTEPDRTRVIPLSKEDRASWQKGLSQEILSVGKRLFDSAIVLTFATPLQARCVKRRFLRDTEFGGFLRVERERSTLIVPLN